MLLKVIAISFGAYAAMELGACVLSKYHKRKEEEEEAARQRSIIRAIEAERRQVIEREAKRSELLERLSKAYKKAKARGVHNFYLAALSHCCQLLQRGEEIDEGAALLALRGLEGDAKLDAEVEAILNRRAGE